MEAEREVLYGKQAIGEVLRAGRRRVEELWVVRGGRLAGPAADILKEARRCRVPVRECEKRELDRATASGHHQGLALLASPFAYTAFDALLAAAAGGPEPAFLLVLDHVQDPQNLGSLMRTADAAGVHGVLLPSRGAASVTPAVVRASSGAVEHLSVARAPDFNDALDELKRRGIALYGLEAGEASQPYSTQDFTRPTALVVGHEGEGLTKTVRRRCDALIRLPMRGRVDSLNAAIAGAIALYEVRRQRDAGGKGV